MIQPGIRPGIALGIDLERIVLEGATHPIFAPLFGIQIHGNAAVIAGEKRMGDPMNHSGYTRGKRENSTRHL
jgi:hypothetical protein